MDDIHGFTMVGFIECIKASLDTMHKELIQEDKDTSYCASHHPPGEIDTHVAYSENSKDLETHNQHLPFILTNPNDWEAIQQSDIIFDNENTSTSFSLQKWWQSPSSKLKTERKNSMPQSTQTDLPQEEETKEMVETLYQDLLQKNTKLRQMELENDQLTQQLIQIKKEPPIQIEKECATCSQRLSGHRISAESESQLGALLEQSRMECQLDRKEKIYWKKECEKLRDLVDILENELSLEKSKAVRFQQLNVQQEHEIVSLKGYINSHQCSNPDEKEKEELSLELERAHSQIRVLQSTVHQLSDFTHYHHPTTTVTSDMNSSYSPPKQKTYPNQTLSLEQKPTPASEGSEESRWETYLETAQQLERDLKELQHRREMLQAEYVKVPLTGVQNRRRKEELDVQLDSVDKDIGYIRMKLKTMNFL